MLVFWVVDEEDGVFALIIILPFFVLLRFFMNFDICSFTKIKPCQSKSFLSIALSMMIVITI